MAATLAVGDNRLRMASGSVRPGVVIQLDHIEFRKADMETRWKQIRGACFQSVRELQLPLDRLEARFLAKWIECGFDL
jgi:hypothetical protein